MTTAITTCGYSQEMTRCDLDINCFLDFTASVVHNVNMTTQMVPSRGELERYLSRKLTQQQIVEAWEKDSGVRVSRPAIAMAIERYGLKSANPRPRYEDTLPWTVLDEHAHHNDARMLRLEGRRRSGGTLSDKEKRLLRNWKELLEQVDAVVHYDPDTEKGFWWLPREERDGDDLIRRP